MSAKASAKDIVLASGSRARREMLAAAGVPFTVQAAGTFKFVEKIAPD